MAGTVPKVDRELLGRVAALTHGQQRWLRTVLQSVLTMESPSRRSVAEEAREERPRRARPKGSAPEAPAPEAPAPEAEKEPRRKGLDELLSGKGGTEEEYPELAEELEGMRDIADLLRESGSERRRFGEELMRLFEAGDEGTGKDEEEDDKGARFN